MALVINGEKVYVTRPGGSEEVGRGEPVYLPGKPWAVLTLRETERRIKERAHFESYKQETRDGALARIKSLTEDDKGQEAAITNPTENLMEDERQHPPLLLPPGYPPGYQKRTTLVNQLPLANGWRRAAQPPEEGEASNEIPHGQGEVRGQRDATQKITKRGLGKGGEGAHRKEPAAIGEGGNGNKERVTEERDARGNKGGARSGTSTTTAQKSRDADEDEGQASLAPPGKGSGEKPSNN